MVFLVVATHKLCCCILEKCLIDVTPVQHKVFADVILGHSNYSRLVSDQFGRLALQYLISINIWMWTTDYMNTSGNTAWQNRAYTDSRPNSRKSFWWVALRIKWKVRDFQLWSSWKFGIFARRFEQLYKQRAKYGNYVVRTLKDILRKPHSRLLHWLFNRGSVCCYLLWEICSMLVSNFLLIRYMYRLSRSGSRIAKKRPFIEQKDPRSSLKSTVYKYGGGKAYQKRPPCGSSSSLRFGRTLIRNYFHVQHWYLDNQSRTAGATRTFSFQITSIQIYYKDDYFNEVNG